MQEQTTTLVPTPPAGGEVIRQDGARHGDIIPADAARGATAQYVAFEIAGEDYGVDIMAVREIKVWEGATALPDSPDYMRGVINLRGVVVPIFDMRARFGMGLTEASKTHVVIILSVGKRLLGTLVDSVSDILTVVTQDIQPVPKIDRAVDNDYLSGLVNADERMVALLAIERLFDLEKDMPSDG